MKVFVIIVTYNGMEWIERCLGSLVNQSICVEIIVVDNGSTDGTNKYIKQNFSKIILKEPGHNLGFGQANNLGIKYALENRCDYVYLLNQDAWIENDTIEKLIKIHQCNPQYGILSPLQMNSNKTKIDKNLLWLISNEKNTDLVSGLHTKKTFDVYPIKFVMAAHWFISRDCLEIVGGFSPLFFHYGEDGNYLDRVRYYNYNIGLCTGLKVVHDREFRRESIEKKLYIGNISIWVGFANINKTFLVSLVRFYYYLLKLNFKFIILHKKIKLPVTYIIRGVFKFPSFYKNREKSKLQGAFLDHIKI